MLTSETGRLADEFEHMRGKHADEAAAAGVRFGQNWFLRWKAARDLAAGRRLAACAGYLRVALASRSTPLLARAAGALAPRRVRERALERERGKVACPAWLRAHQPRSESVPWPAAERS
jgi:hypothetical protein